MNNRYFDTAIETGDVKLLWNVKLWIQCVENVIIWNLVIEYFIKWYIYIIDFNVFLTQVFEIKNDHDLTFERNIH